MKFDRRRKKGKDLNELVKKIEVDAHYVDLQELCRRFNTNLEKGMTAEAVEESRKKYGLNKIKTAKKSPEWVKFFNSLFGGFALILWLGSFLCFLAFALRASAFENTPNDNLYLGIALVGVAIITGLLSFYEERKSAKIMSSFKTLLPQTVVTLRGGIKSNIKAELLVPGDIIEVFDGDIIPADMRILSVSGFKVDHAPLTGESKSLERTHQLTHRKPLETKNLAFFATYAVEGSARGMVFNTGKNTVMGRIAGLSNEAKFKKATFISKEMNIFIRYMVQFALIIGLTFFIFAIYGGYHYLDAVVFLIGTIVAMVPEGLIVTVSVSLALTAHKMAAKNCLIKNLETVETLGSTSIICSDKTGTLTQNKIFVSHVCLNNKIYPMDNSETPIGIASYQNLPEWTKLEHCMALCNNAEFKEDQNHLPIVKREIIGNPFEAALLRCVELSTRGAIEYRQKFKKVMEIPFNNINKYQLSIHKNLNGSSHCIVAKGAPEVILDMCSTMLYNGKQIPMTEEWKNDFEDVYTKLCNIGERVVGFCEFQLPKRDFPVGFLFNKEEVNFPMNKYCFIGLVSLVDPPRPCVPAAIATCRSAGIKVIMITGDHPETAKAIAKEVGIISAGNKTVEDMADELGIPLDQVDQKKINSVVIHGSVLEEMTDDDIDELILSYPEIVFARMTPEQKLLVVEGCQRIGAIVAVTGDGVNDCPALIKADVGIAMGISGSTVSKKAADMILLDDNFATIVSGIEEGRLIFDNLKKSIAYTLSSNIPEMCPFLMFIILGIPLALGTVTIICIDLGTDVLPAISLAYEAPENDLMKRRPRNPYSEKLVDAKLISESCGQIGMIQAFAGFFTYVIIMCEHGFLPERLMGLRKSWNSPSINDLEDSYGQEWTYQDRKALEYTCHTAFFVTIVIVQWADVLICKTRKISIFSQGMNNWVLNFALLFETCLALFLCYTPGMDKALQMYPLRWNWWLPALPFSVLIFTYDECRKLLMRNLPANNWFFSEKYY